MEELKKRKTTRWKGADYNSTGAFFITVCTENRRCMLCEIVGTGVLDGPKTNGFVSTLVDTPNVPFVKLSQYGMIADKYIKQLNDFYKDISVESYVIMPNHIHLLLVVNVNGNGSASTTVHDGEIPANGPSGTPVPTIQNSIVARFVSTFKRFCNKEYGGNIWQYRSNDHVIRDRQDYAEHARYIYENPMRWHFDELYSAE